MVCGGCCKEVGAHVPLGRVVGGFDVEHEPFACRGPGARTGGGPLQRPSPLRSAAKRTAVVDARDGSIAVVTARVLLEQLRGRVADAPLVVRRCGGLADAPDRVRVDGVEVHVVGIGRDDCRTRGRIKGDVKGAHKVAARRCLVCACAVDLASPSATTVDRSLLALVARRLELGIASIAIVGDHAVGDGRKRRRRRRCRCGAGRIRRRRWRRPLWRGYAGRCQRRGGRRKGRARERRRQRGRAVDDAVGGLLVAALRAARVAHADAVKVARGVVVLGALGRARGDIRPVAGGKERVAQRLHRLVDGGRVRRVVAVQARAAVDLVDAVLVEVPNVSLGWDAGLVVGRAPRRRKRRRWRQWWGRCRRRERRRRRAGRGRRAHERAALDLLAAVGRAADRPFAEHGADHGDAVVKHQGVDAVAGTLIVLVVSRVGVFGRVGVHLGGPGSVAVVAASDVLAESEVSTDLGGEGAPRCDNVLVELRTGVARVVGRRRRRGWACNPRAAQQRRALVRRAGRAVVVVEDVLRVGHVQQEAPRRVGALADGLRLRNLQVEAAQLRRRLRAVARALDAGRVLGLLARRPLALDAEGGQVGRARRRRRGWRAEGAADAFVVVVAVVERRCGLARVGARQKLVEVDVLVPRLSRIHDVEATRWVHLVVRGDVEAVWHVAKSDCVLRVLAHRADVRHVRHFTRRLRALLRRVDDRVGHADAAVEVVGRLGVVLVGRRRRRRRARRRRGWRR